MNVSEMSLDTNILSLGSLLGSTGSQELVRDINRHCGNSTFFGSADDPFRQGFARFMETIAVPIRQVGMQVKSAVDKIFKKDEIRPIVSMKDLQHIPPCMHAPIIYHPPVRKMLEEERIDGFGIDPKKLEDGDIYNDVLESGHCWISSDTLGKDGSIEYTTFESSDAPELTKEECMDILATRYFLNQIMEDEKTEHFDVTDFPNLHC